VTVTVAHARSGFDPDATGRQSGLRSLSHDARSLHARLGMMPPGDRGPRIEIGLEAGDG
jgi:hypothetical protein